MCDLFKENIRQLNYQADAFSASMNPGGMKVL